MKGGTLLVSRLVKLHEDYKRKLEDLGFWNVIATDADKAELSALIIKIKPALMIISSMFYQSATPYMLAVLKRKHPYLNIAAVTLYDYPADLGVKFISNGVNSYVNYADGKKEFYEAMRILRKGDTYISPSVLKRLSVRRVLWPEATDINEKEIAVLRDVCNGFTAGEIGKELNLSKRTVDYYKAELFNKLGARNENELIRIALYLEIVKIDELNFYGGNYRIRPIPGNKYGIRNKRGQ